MSSDIKMSAIAEPLRLITSPPISSKSKLTAPITSSALTMTPPAGILTHPDFANSYQLDIISALRGNEHNFLARAAIADAIRVLQSDEDKLELIDFLASKEQGAIALTLENNACKMFNCTPSELPLVSNHHQTKKHFLSKLSELFNIALHKSIPTVFAMLFPLQQFDSNFKIRKIIFHHFRDRVLIRLLANFEFKKELFEEDPNLQRALGQMFGLIHIEFAGEMGESESFNRIYANFLGEDTESAGAANEDEASETVKMGRKVGMAAIGERKREDLMRQWQPLCPVIDRFHLRSLSGRPFGPGVRAVQPVHRPLFDSFRFQKRAGSAAVLLPFLHHISMNTVNETIEVRLSTVYRRQLAIFVRDLTFLVASISIGCLSSLSLTIPVLVVPILVTAWTTLFEKQKPPIVRGLFLAGPLCLFFLNLSLGGLYGTFLVDAKQLSQPGIIFTIVAGIGSSVIQFAKARAQFKPLCGNHQAPQQYVHDENLDKLEYEKNPVDYYYTTTSSNAADKAERGNNWPNTSRKSTALTEIIRCWVKIQFSLLRKWPFQCAVGFLACLVHSFAYPVFTRLTGLFFSIFEQKKGKKDFLVREALWICSAYAIMGLIVFGAVILWNTIFGQMGLRLQDELERDPKFDEKSNPKRIDSGRQTEIVPVI
uniref:Uncharacterized protein n=1 Tax=Globodera rostochiensis TaxID=31243 RepID=A0A914HJ10_GLORO